MIPRFGASYLVFGSEKYKNTKSGIEKNASDNSAVEEATETKQNDACGHLLDQCHQAIASLFSFAGLREKKDCTIEHCTIELSSLTPTEITPRSRLTYDSFASEPVMYSRTSKQ